MNDESFLEFFLLQLKDLLSKFKDRTSFGETCMCISEIHMSDVYAGDKKVADEG